jgi:hypothetical protein
VIYVYAVTEPVGCAPTERGLEGEPLRVVATESLAAVVSDREAVQLAVDEHALWAHERVVEELMLDRAVLPMRFGSVLGDDAAIRRLLVTRQHELTEALRRVGGAVELGVRVAWPEQETTSDEVTRAAPGPGAAYLLARSRRDRRVRALAEQLDRSLVDLSRARVQRLPRSPHAPLRAAYLVEEEHVDTFRVRIATLERDVVDAHIVCTGPWPPYSFTGGQAW